MKRELYNFLIVIEKTFILLKSYSSEYAIWVQKNFKHTNLNSFSQFVSSFVYIV